MNTTDTTASAAVREDVVASLTDAEVLAFLVRKTREIANNLAPLCARAGLKEASLSIYPAHLKPYYVSAHDAEYKAVGGQGETPEVAIADFTAEAEKRIPNATLLREKAAALLAQAEVLETATPAV